MVPRLVVFDLDGTLIDSRIDLSNSVNAMLAHLGKPELPHEVIAGFIGNGVGVLVRKALGDADGDLHDDEYVNRAVEFFLDYYREHKLDYTYVYDGVTEALEGLRAEYPKLAMAVLTNKPVRPSRDICAHFGLDRFFFQNYGGNSFATKKPEPTGLLALMAEASALNAAGGPIRADETVMIGDSDVDVQTARSCGAWAVGCTFGLSPQSLAAAPPDVLSHTPADWPETLRVLAGSAMAR
jgi:phosphoglycolate phosphatase